MVNMGKLLKMLYTRPSKHTLMRFSVLFYRIATVPQGHDKLFCLLCGSTISLGTVPTSRTQIYTTVMKHILDRHPEILYATKNRKMMHKIVQTLINFANHPDRNPS